MGIFSFEFNWNKDINDISGYYLMDDHDTIDDIIDTDDIEAFNKFRDKDINDNNGYYLHISLQNKSFNIARYILSHKDVEVSIDNNYILKILPYKYISCDLFEEIISHDTFKISCNKRFIKKLIKKSPEKFGIYYEKLNKKKRNKVHKILLSKKSIPIELYHYIIDYIEMDYKTMEMLSMLSSKIDKKISDNSFLPKNMNKLI